MTGTIAVERSLVDTNILVYAYDVADLPKHEAAKGLLRRLSDAGALCFSVQVVNEFCSVMMRAKRPNRLSASELVDVVREIMAIGDVLPLTASITAVTLNGSASHGLSFWGALIWAVAKENGVPVVCTEDFQHGRVVEGVRFVNPFLDGG